VLSHTPKEEEVCPGGDGLNRRIPPSAEVWWDSPSVGSVPGRSPPGGWRGAGFCHDQGITAHAVLRGGRRALGRPLGVPAAVGRVRQGLPRPYTDFKNIGVLPSNRDLKVSWQVINTVAHAASAGGLRGQIFEARARGGRQGTSPDDKVNWEHTRYTGGHLIEAFLVRDNTTVVARSGRRKVLIENPSRPPRGRRRHRR
jgi:hypothetical protein